MSKITGLTSTSKKNFQLDAGALYKNWAIGTDTPANASAKLIGATQGGAPEARTERYYKKRPCVELVKLAARLLEEDLVV